jgi:hypothetical protein
MSRELQTKNGRINLHLCETTGQERYRSLVPAYPLVVYDFSAADIFQNVQGWVNEF